MFMVILTLPTVVSHVAFLTQAVILCTRSPVHTANITVLDCGQNNTNTHRQRQTHRATLGLKIRNIHGILDLQHKQNVLWTILFKVVLKYIFLEIYGLQTDERIRLKRCELQESNMEEMLTVDVFQKTHTPSRLTHTHARNNSRDWPLFAITWLQHMSIAWGSFRDVFRRFFGFVSSIFVPG